MAAHEEDLIDYSDDEIPTTEAQPANGAAKKAAAANGAKGSTYSGIHTTSFKDMFLRPEIMKAINGCGFEHPSDVQQSAIPRAILQNDVICQAKSGLGKTAVFVISTLQQLEETGLDGEVQALVICHTRDLAYQIKNEFTRFAKYMTFVKIALFYGGVDIKEDEKILADKKNFPNIVVGTPGRLHALVRDGKLRLGHLRFFIIDECDKVLDKTDMRQDVQAIFRTTPSKKQVMMFSATLSQEIRPICKKFMNNPHEIYVDDEKELTLHGLQQYRVKLNENEKNRKLNEVLDDLEYNQVMIFVKSQNRAIELTKLLREANFPAESAYGTLKQEERINTYNGFKNFDSRILVCTDVFARGVDFQRVNLVVNYDMPDTRNTSEKAITDDSISDSARTYLHRVGRAGRFGTKGVAISFIASEYDTQLLARIVEHQAIDIAEYPEGGQGVDLSSAANNA